MSFLFVFTVFRTAVNTDWFTRRREFMVTFLLVFTGLEPAANSDIPIFLSMACLPIGLDVFLGRSLSSFR